MSKLNGFICPVCLRSCPDGQRHAGCKGSIDGLVSCWEYEQVTQRIIKEIKYRFYYAGIGILTGLLITKMQKSVSFSAFLKTKPIIVPVPLHPKRLRYRGFNQAQLIARQLSKAWSLPVSSKLLVRTTFSKPQAELTRQQREKNVAGMFAANPGLARLGKKPLAGKSTLLVDDVWTTGSTCRACAGILKGLGAKSVWSLTLAR